MFIMAFESAVKIGSSFSDDDNTIWEPGNELLLNKSFLLYFNTVIPE